MGAHSLRTASRLGRTDVIYAVIVKFGMKDAGPFHAQESPFFYLHAQLWLLIALARIALDDPGAVVSITYSSRRLPWAKKIIMYGGNSSQCKFYLHASNVAGSR